MNKKKELAKNTLIIAVGKISTQLVAFLMLPIYTFFLSPSDYGVFDLAVSYVFLLAPTLTLQTEMAAFRFLIDARQDYAKKSRVISSALQIILITIVSIIIGYLLLDHFVEIRYSSLLLMNICAVIVSGILMQFARGMGDNRRFAISGILAGFITFLANLAFIVFAGWGVEALFVSMLIANISCSVYLFLSLRIFKYIASVNVDKNIQLEMIKYSLPLVPNGISWWIINVSDRTIITIFMGISSNGIYAISNKFALIFMSVYGIFNLSWTEAASLHINDKDRDRFFSDTSNVSLKFFGGLGLLLLVSVPFVFPFLINDDFSEAYLYVPVLILSALFSSIVGIYSAVYVAKKKTKQVAVTSIFTAVINITLTLVFIKFYGLYAASGATAFAYLAMAIYRHYDVKKFVNIIYKKTIMLQLGVLYIFTTSMYYLNNPTGNIVNVLVTVTSIILMNQKNINHFNKLLLSKLNKRRRNQVLSE